jgi:hypothetical protein
MHYPLSRPMFVEQNKTKTLCLWEYKRSRKFNSNDNERKATAIASRLLFAFYQLVMLFSNFINTKVRMGLFG